MFKAEILADSKNQFGNRITTMKIVFPRYILAEMNTHRMFSRNSASSRAIPFEKMVKMVKENPFIPMAWQVDHKGMQGSAYMESMKTQMCVDTWLSARDHQIDEAEKLNKGIGVTKQLANRLLEPFMWHTVIVTATEWENFFALRCPRYEFEVGGMTHKYRSWNDMRKHTHQMADSIKFEFQIDIEICNKVIDPIERLKYNKGQADIHMMEIAELMWDVYQESVPQELKPGEWHIPFGDQIELPPTIPIEEGLTLEEGVQMRKIKIATARCARISYQTLGDDSKIDYEADVKLHDILAKSGHWSPFEHIAKAMDQHTYVRSVNEKLHDDKFDAPVPTDESEGWSGNFRGFVQYRKMFSEENIK